MAITRIVVELDIGRGIPPAHGNAIVLPDPIVVVQNIVVHDMIWAAHQGIRRMHPETVNRGAHPVVIEEILPYDPGSGRRWPLPIHMDRKIPIIVNPVAFNEPIAAVRIDAIAGVTRTDGPKGIVMDIVVDNLEIG